MEGTGGEAETRDGFTMLTGLAAPVIAQLSEFQRHHFTSEGGYFVLSILLHFNLWRAI